MISCVLDSPFPGGVSCLVGETTSTMAEARALSAMHPYGVVVAERQTAGRGRLEGRTWEARKSESVLATFWFPAGAFDGAPLPLLAGIAVVKACRKWAAAAGASFRSELALKWPNDVLANGRKLAGILCEASGNVLYAGIGLNCAQSGFQGEFRRPPTSICMETGLVPDRLCLVQAMADSFFELSGNTGAWLDDYNGLLAWKGSLVDFRKGMADGAAVRGRVEGVDGTGAIVLRGETGSEAFSSGELQLVIDEGTYK